MTLQQLKGMNEKERTLYLSTIKVKELKHLLKGTTRITHLKKREALELVINLTCRDELYEMSMLW